MAQEGLKLTATARVTLTKLDEDGNIIGVEESDVTLTEEEAHAIWQSQTQA
jgi:hypothetical protein